MDGGLLASWQWSNNLQWIYRQTGPATGGPGVFLDDWNVPNDQSWLVRLITFWNQDTAQVRVTTFALSGLGGLYAPFFAFRDVNAGNNDFLIGANPRYGTTGQRGHQPQGFLVPSGGTLRCQIVRNSGLFPVGTSFLYQIFYQVLPPQQFKDGRTTVDNEQIP